MVTQPPAAQSTANPARKSSAARTDAGGLSIRDQAAWRQQSPYSWVCGSYTICAVRVNGEIQFELWRNSAFCCRAPDAATLRTVAAAGGAVG